MKLDSSLFCQWQHTLSNFEVDQVAADKAFNLLVEAYCSSDRYYHTLKHIYHVLKIIDNLEAHTINLAAVQLAAWFHDVVYDTKAENNEEKSADYACELLSSFGIPPSNIIAVTCLIINTKNHQAAADDFDSQVLLDADLAILAANPVQYREYALYIRQEYAWVSEAEYIVGRVHVLESFLQRQRIYFTSLMFEVGEKAARYNLNAEIQFLLAQ
jgi:predicted metal-dependent HD superfamily phosphohydrolase